MRVSATDRVHALLREAIISGELASGSLHSIYRMAERFGVSRTPVRDAVLRLADAGMLEIERNRGVRIKGIGIGEIRDVFETRLLLEVPAAAYAAANVTLRLTEALTADIAALEAAMDVHDTARFTRHDRELHTTLLLASGNRRLADVVAALRDATQVRDVRTADRSRSLQEIHQEHLPIVEAVMAGDASGAAAHMRSHLVNTALLLMKQVASGTGEQIPENWPSSLVP
ncbi:MAG TPA: GntR family transcriptional regulator [Microbacteriaceae bacterium]|jgi:Transcriptional regulators